MRHEIAHAFEPERRQLRQDPALVGNPRSEHVVKRRNPVRCDEQQVVTDAIDVANLAAAMQLQIGEVGLEKRRCCNHVVCGWQLAVQSQQSSFEPADCTSERPTANGKLRTSANRKHCKLQTANYKLKTANFRQLGYLPSG